MTRVGTNGIQAAVATLLAFDLVTRPSEILGVKRSHCFPPNRRHQHWAVVICPSTEDVTTKTGQQDDTLLLADGAAGREWLGPVLNALRQRCKPGQPLFSISLAVLERLTR